MTTINGSARITEIDTEPDCYCGNCGVDYSDLTLDGLRLLVGTRGCPACFDYLDSITSEMQPEVTTAGDYRHAHGHCTAELVGHDGEILDDGATITVSANGQQYMVGTDSGKVDEWIDLC